MAFGRKPAAFDPEAPLLDARDVRVEIAGEVILESASLTLERGELVVKPLSDAGMDLRDIEVQTLADRTLQPATEAFLQLLVANLSGD